MHRREIRLGTLRTAAPNAMHICTQQHHGEIEELCHKEKEESILLCDITIFQELAELEAANQLLELKRD